MRRMKIINITVVSLLLITLSACSLVEINKKPDILEIRNIANLSTLECYYHNVAKSGKAKGTGFTHWFEKDRVFWIEYTGSVKLGIDMTQVEMEINENEITITIPQAKVIGEPKIIGETWNENSLITSDDSVNSNKITSADVTDAINKAQEEMKETASKNTTMLNNAQMRAKTLIENYINQLGEITNTKYIIKWKYISQNDNFTSNEHEQ